MTNRIIKFRAWQNDINQQMIGYDRYGGPDQFWFMVENHKWPVMQFTGLHDKNGKEIYEGDVVSGPAWYKTLGRCGIEKIESRLVEITKFGVTPFISHDFSGEGGCEVVGNKYENPELLK